MRCPVCNQSVVKRGFYTRPSDQKRIQRYHCKNCKKSLSTQTVSFDYRLRRRRCNQVCFRLLCSGLSQRRCALILGMKPASVARRVRLFGHATKRNLSIYRAARPAVSSFLIDEMETFEHTKCKPLTIPIAVEQRTRKILSLEVGRIAAKGL